MLWSQQDLIQYVFLLNRLVKAGLMFVTSNTLVTWLFWLFLLVLDVFRILNHQDLYGNYKVQLNLYYKMLAFFIYYTLCDPAQMTPLWLKESMS